MFFLINSTSAWVGGVMTASVAFNFIAAVILTAALLPPWLDTKRSRKTYGVGKDFFSYYVMGAGMMLLNAILNLFVNYKDITMVLLFVCFASINSLSLYLNSYILKVKQQNMKEAEERGISEQDYWEQYIKPTLAVDESDVSGDEANALTDPAQL